MFERTVLMHEIGHWLGVPTRKYHSDGEHCTCEKCVMLPGKLKLDTILPILFNAAFEGVPSDFCPHCEQELVEMKRRRGN